MPEQSGKKWYSVVSHANQNMSILLNFCGLVGENREGSVAIFVFIDIFPFLNFSFYIVLFTFFKQ